MDNETVLHRWFEEVWNRGRADAIDELTTDEVIIHGLADATGEPVRGRDAFKPYHQALRAAFPDVRVVIEDAIESGDKVMVRCRITATHSGPGLTPSPTNRKVEFTGMCLARIKDGKLAEGWNNFDFLSLYQQLGMQLR
jgi:steroid delta-isomerase-like uncharacterized protein